jgi:hypothetical protein
MEGAMPRVTELVDDAYLVHAPPRPFPAAALPALIGDTALRRPLLDPALLACAAILGLLLARDAWWPLLLPPLAGVLWWVWRRALGVWRKVCDEVGLLRHGRTVRARVLRLRPHRNTLGEIDGALLFCAIPVAARRTYVGSVWLSDGTEALRLHREGRVNVICLPRTPGTWRIVDALHSEQRYDTPSLTIAPVAP